MNRKPKITILTEKEKLVSDREQTVDVLVRISPPESDTSEFSRPKLNIGIALDRSGSMQGQKMHEAREAAKYCAEQLLPDDRFSTVIFDDQVDVMFTNQLATDKATFKRGIDRIRSRNSTALHRGWVTAGIQVSEHLDREAVNRILLITDGQANVGETNVDRIVRQASELAAKGVSTSTVGIGTDFNEDLLMPMAEAGQGNAWHVQEPQDMVKIFATEMKGLISQIGHSVSLAVNAAPEAAVVDVLNDFDLDTEFRSILPNLQAGSPLDVVIRLRLDPQQAGSLVPIAEFELSYIGQDSAEAVTLSQTLFVEFDADKAVEALPISMEVATASQLLMNARARREAIERMDRDDFAGSIQSLQCAAEDTNVLFSRISTPELSNELDDLKKVSEQLNSGDEDVMARKRMAYRRESIRKGK